MRWRNLYAAYQALKKTQILGGKPLRQITLFAWYCLRYGISLYALAAWAAQRYPNQIALVADIPNVGSHTLKTNAISFQQLLVDAEQLSLSLALDNIGAGKSVAFLGRNSPELVITLLACGRLGANILLLNTKSTNEQIANIISTNKIDCFISDQEFRHLVPATGNFLLRDSQKNPLVSTSKKLPRRKSGLITILTSGSTGHAKSIRRKPKINEVLQTFTYLLEKLQLKSERKILLTLPMIHGHGLASLILSLASGSSLHIFAHGNTDAYLARIDQHRINVLILVPTILYRILQTTNTITLLQSIISGSAPLNPELVTRTMEKYGAVLFNIYGTSEAGIISIATPEDLRIAPNSVGKPLKNVKLHITDQQEIYLRTDFLSMVINSGDSGYLENDRLFLLGRQDELMICGGENIYPENIEQRITQLDYVSECAVKGISDAEYGQAIHLFVVLNKSVSHEAIRNDMTHLFPRSQRPKLITELSELPRNAMGKLQRHLLQSI
jgi:acyl-CoA synthetase (AMP-forming)/AMP-acid ligase II